MRRGEIACPNALAAPMPLQSSFASASLTFLADTWRTHTHTLLSSPANSFQIEEITTQPVLVVKCGQTSCL